MISRRSFVAGIVGRLVTRPGKAETADEPLLVNVVSSLKNPYYLRWTEGGAAYAASRVARYSCIETEGHLQVAVEKIGELIRSSGANVVFNIDLASIFHASDFAKSLADSNVYYVLNSFEPPDIHPWEENPYFVCHVVNDHTMAGAKAAGILLQSIGGTGGIVGIGGPAKDIPGQQRRSGLEKMLKANPGCALLDFRSGEYEASVSFELTKAFLGEFGNRVRGIWAANDRMAIGSVEALRVYGLVGKVPVVGIDGFPGVMPLIKEGEMLATAAWDPYYDGGMGLSIAHDAHVGLIKVIDLPDRHRELQRQVKIINKDNVDFWEEYNISRNYRITWNDYWGRAEEHHGDND
jgi:ribose transport system substrate-binding protein